MERKIREWMTKENGLGGEKVMVQMTGLRNIFLSVSVIPSSIIIWNTSQARYNTPEQFTKKQSYPNRVTEAITHREKPVYISHSQQQS